VDDNLDMSESLRARRPLGMAGSPEPPERYEPIHPGSGRPPLRKRLARLLAPLALLLAKAKSLLLLLPNLKLLATFGSMAVSIGAYSLLFGLPFAVGFVVLLLLHEMGHVVALRREGVKASAPVFIPFLGAVIAAKSLGKDAAAEARVGLAGPIVGSLGALACVGLHAATGNNLFLALAFTGFFLNLFNLLPVGFLDGARAAAALSPWVWLLGVFGIVLLVLTIPNPIIILIAVLGIYETWVRFRQFRKGGDEVRKYYSISRRDRILIGVTYLSLIIALVVAMDLTHLQRDIPN
jgi:Zn-dependent protease